MSDIVGLCVSFICYLHRIIQIRMIGNGIAAQIRNLLTQRKMGVVYGEPDIFNIVGGVGIVGKRIVGIHNNVERGIALIKLRRNGKRLDNLGNVFGVVITNKQLLYFGIVLQKIIFGSEHHSANHGKYGNGNDDFQHGKSLLIGMKSERPHLFGIKRRERTALTIASTGIATVDSPVILSGSG